MFATLYFATFLLQVLDRSALTMGLASLQLTAAAMVAILGANLSDPPTRPDQRRATS